MSVSIPMIIKQYTRYSDLMNWGHLKSFNGGFSVSLKFPQTGQIQPMGLHFFFCFIYTLTIATFCFTALLGYVNTHFLHFGRRSEFVVYLFLFN